ncbi:hypothetical protein FKV24_015235 [Lysobacter maris]|uniref:Uncharacterized protein n=1 Tax=Marilutibacter maris TaxID=1605891 RepID=A0A508A6S5_9GAMM|nr:hypothetical protein [Lysobacter maris]KAB8172193.1 hypothetical protein FKV24_015235 [Lysobacter maris]
MTRAFLVVFVLLVGLSGVVEAHEVFRYIDPAFPQKRIAIDVDRRQFLVADVGEDMEVCEPGSPFICVESETLSFHFPRVLGQGQAEWEAHGRKYRVESVENYELWGRQERLMRIRMDAQGQSTFYLYSEEVGLMGIGFVNPKTRAYVTYLIDGDRGFGSARTMSETP